MPEMSVIVVNWNGRHFLEVCLSALRRQTFRDFETILVDNGSNDGSVEYVKAHFPDVSLIALGENTGFTGANIAGYVQAKGELIVLLNNDTEADPMWLEEIHKASSAYPEAGSFACKMLYFDERNRIENCGMDLGAGATVVDLGRDEIDGPEWAVSRKVFGGCGGAVAYRRHMLEEIGFLDTDFFIFFEDVDLSFRAQLRGHQCIFLPQAIVYHRYRATTKKGPAVFCSQRNIELVYLKNMPMGLIFRSLPQRLMYEVGAAIYFTKSGSGRAFLRGKLDVLRHLPSTLRKRKEIQSRKTVSSSELREIMRKPVFASKWKKFRAGWLAVPVKQS
ncbi:MAG: glycosyltransferase family 2 protein [Candidatus Sulfotelmatobacter sp.]